MTAVISESEWARLWAEARARGGYPPFICKTVVVPDAELAADPRPGPLAWLGALAARIHPAPEPEPEPEAGI